ncbi:MAG: FAD:protein FMN transferase [Melioribacteraceae bacterium]|nr:FAD:protein FMN transferase [Melioribacteraceae bacterium]
MKYRKYLILVLSVIFILGCEPENTGSLHTFSGSTMGTTYSIKVVNSRNSALLNPSSIKSKVDSILTEVNRQMSTYLPDSEISRFNKSQSTDWFDASEDFVHVLDKSIQIGYNTKGALDITIGHLVNLWGFGPNYRPQVIPAEQEIENAKLRIGLDKIHADVKGRRVRKSIPELYCDLSSTAKGFGVDKVADFLSGNNIENYLVEIGGEIRVKGLNQSGHKWKVGISEPDIAGGIERVLELNNMSMATSGDYWNYFEENGIRYSHLIDPRTGKPIQHNLASVSVISEYCIEADGYATAIEILGPVEGLNFANEMELAVFMIVRANNNEFNIITSKKFKELYN